MNTNDTSTQQIIKKGGGECYRNGSYPLALSKQRIDWLIANPGGSDISFGELLLQWTSIVRSHFIVQSNLT